MSSGNSGDLACLRASNGVDRHLVDCSQKAVAAGDFSFLTPTKIIAKVTEEMKIDAVRMVFQNIPGTGERRDQQAPNHTG
jgi:alkyl sulfatase BDS1-like metallo-beta-lactamase superfamily hydrolase